MAYSKTTDEIIRELNSFIAEAKVRGGAIRFLADEINGLGDAVKRRIKA